MLRAHTHMMLRSLRPVALTRGISSVSALTQSRIAQKVKTLAAQRMERKQAVTGAESRQYSISAEPEPQPETPLTETIRDFLDPSDFYNLLKENRIDFYTGVPDSLLKDFCAYVTDTAPPSNHVITANEGAAIAVAAGYQMATKKFPVVYMQNSGFGNAVNPLLSLCDAQIYGIPMLLLIGWRGEPGKRDEPQHMVQGKIMSSMLADMNLKFEVLPDYLEGAQEAVASAVHHMETRSAPYAFLVKRQCFTKYKLKNREKDVYELSREQALNIMIDNLGAWDVVVATTGFTSRELYEIRVQRKQGHNRDFLTVGSMGHATAVGMGIALAKPSRNVYCLDGDGAALMHMGTMGTVGVSKVGNFKHILINNGAHDSVGGQPTRGFDIDFLSVARACGYKYVRSAHTAEDIATGMQELRRVDGPALLEVKVNKGARSNLGRPKESPRHNKEEFMRFLEG